MRSALPKTGFISETSPIALADSGNVSACGLLGSSCSIQDRTSSFSIRKGNYHMPCGGIYPMDNHSSSPCLMCGGRHTDLWCEEYEGHLHSDCVPGFLETLWGKAIVDHGHKVVVRTVDGTATVHEERTRQ